MHGKFEELAGWYAKRSTFQNERQKIELDVERLDLIQNNLKLSFIEFNQHAKKTKDGIGTAKLAKQYLHSIKNKNSLPRIPRKPDRKAVMQHFLALQRLAQALQSNEENYVALLTENKEYASSLDELARYLQESDDKEKLSELLEGGYELLNEEEIGNPVENLFSLLKASRHKKNELKEKLKSRQKLPDLNPQEKREFLDKITSELHLLEQENYSLLYGTINSSKASQETSDPDTFLDSYTDAIHSAEDLSSQVENLCKHYDIKELTKILPAMKKALAEDLESDARSIDKPKLQHIISNMSILNMAHTILLKVINFSAEMLRIFENKINEKNLLLSLIKLVSSSSASQTQIENLVLDQHIKERNSEIYFLTQGIKGIISEFHTKYFDSLEGRNSLLFAAQGAIDSAILSEEENQSQLIPSTS
jgi:hypothetical protein